jgi:3-phenylpropionate/trans-cinnamate dioxygenase ferredoxin subunit
MSESEWVKVATVDSLAPGQMRRVRYNDHPVALFNMDGQFYALDDICSHAEASLSEGEFEDDEVTCPLHGARFRITTGKPRSLPATQPVATYPTRVENGDVFLGPPNTPSIR